MNKKTSTKKPSSPVIKQLMQKELPFACYRLPLENSAVLIAQHNSLLQVFDEKSHASKSGFIFAPFREKAGLKPIFIADEVVKTRKTDTYKAPAVFNIGKGEFLQLIKTLKGKINAGEARKVVAARSLIKRKSKTFDAYGLFDRLCKKYRNAFVSMVYTPTYGLWIGASPEILLEVKGKNIKTYALAGTTSQSPEQSKEWSKKEFEEHNFVADYIREAFREAGGCVQTGELMESVTAGNLRHLRTTFQFRATGQVKWFNLVKKLHPTPAVGGWPKRKALDLIAQLEKNDREYYSGYLGPINGKGQVNLYVNLRSMKVTETQLQFFAGCGITKDSKPEDEWRESKMKTETLLNVINTMK